MSNDLTINLLTGMLDASASRHRVLINNLANTNTPHYTRKDINFEEIMQEIASGKSATVAGLNPEVQDDLSNQFGPDMNNVYRDHELGEMSKNALMYQMGLQLLTTKMSLMRMAITGRT